MSRSEISKGLRFRVLRRDRFTCQYCGAKAHDVVVHVDHILPVAEEGILVFCYTFGRAIPWSDAPYSRHLVPDLYPVGVKRFDAGNWELCRNT